MTTILEIQNLKCNGCANTIINKLNNLDNIHEVSVDNETNTVSFNYSNDEQLELVKKTLVNIGYPVVGDKNAITTKAKSFVSCAIGRMNN
ncbi:heavy-metal-associated domain-containing protein [Flaviramulus sp. BrNp1-15]|uniref:heavy-metal-associated domain-containing protein n=1 Tax=Flaviramulus sp. BrNp1-15 TaxID=2916754 RepID=UPI001EE87D48|nr:heavy metal-associated domain-containing protein [Flaviramulus sp. BrNp1-15]ULC58804.1 heavy-metal-associated domain-containing protein [Flaviramulus sp. BrNp1-15]